MSTLFHIADLHFGREDRGALDWFAQTVRSEQPDVVLVTGDLTTSARKSEYASACVWLSSLGVPLSIEIGNHDLPYFNPWNRIFRPYARYERIERALEKPLDLPDVAIVPLKTTARAQLRMNWSHGYVTRGRVAATVAALKAVPAGKVRMVTCHHPLYDRPGGIAEGKTRGGRNALFALASAGADIVLSGHVHDPFDMNWIDGDRPVRMVGAGTLSERVRASRPSYNRIVVKDGAVEIAPQFMG